MSTNINVVVGDGGIVGRAQREQEEARWKLTERERARREAAPAVAVVTGDAVLEGQTRRLSVVLDELAANRRRKSGTGGIVWVIDKWNLGRDTNYFTGARTAFNYRFPSEATMNSFEFCLGSTDGTAWINGSVPLAGVEEWRSAMWDEIDALPAPATNTSIPPSNLLETSVIQKVLNNFIVLPAGGGNCICIVYARKAFSFAGWYGVLTSTESQSSPEYIPNYDTGPLTSRTVSSSGFKVYLVSKSSIRELTPPAGLTSAMNALLPNVQWTNNVLITYIPKYKEPPASNLYPQLDTAQSPIPVYIATEGPGNNLSRQFEGTSTVLRPTGGSYAQNGTWIMTYDEEIVTGYSYPDFGAAIADYAYASYGFNPGYISGNLFYYWKPSYFYSSPSIFAFFNNTAQTSAAIVTPVFFTIQDPQPDYGNSAAIASYLTSIGYPVPTRATGFDDRDTPLAELVASSIGWNEETGIRDVLYESPYTSWTLPLVSGPMPLNQGDMFYSEDQGPLVRSGVLTFDSNRQDKISTLTYEEDWGGWIQYPMSFYDWNQPAFCRQKLLELGFTPADLTP